MASGVSIVIPSWNGLGLLQRFLPSVLAAARHYSAQSDVPIEIIIIDDGSTDETIGWLRGQGFQEETGRQEECETSGRGLRLARNEKNLGFGETCNRGFQLAAHPLVFLLNNDVEVDVDCIAPLVENFEDESVFAAHCRVFEFDSGREVGTGKLGFFSRGSIRVHRSYAPIEEPGRRLPSQGGVRFPSIFPGGGSTMFDREKLIKIGMFDSLLRPIYWEDVEIGYRAWKRGLSVVYEPRSQVRHRVSSTMRRVNQHRLRRLQQRNRLLFHWIELHDRSLMMSHILWVVLLAITALPRLKPGYLLSLFAALARLPRVARRRREEKRAARRTDREVFATFEALSSRRDIFCYDDDSELERARTAKADASPEW